MGYYELGAVICVRGGMAEVLAVAWVAGRRGELCGRQEAELGAVLSVAACYLIGNTPQ